jgi:hypothetical protein
MESPIKIIRGDIQVATVTKALQNNNKTIGLVWETNGKEVIVLDRDVEIDINCGISIIDAITNKETYLDIIDLIAEALDK